MPFRPPLPIRDGLNPSRVQVPADLSHAPTAEEFLRHLITTQRHRHPEDGPESVMERFAAGAVLADDGRPMTPGDVLRPGSFINFYRRPAPERPVPGELRVLFQDENVVVVDKPPFLATMPRGQHIAETALVKARVQLGIPELSPAHRLDRLTRGVLMMTSRPEVRGAYQMMFDQRLPTKTYEALTPAPEDAPFAPMPAFAGWQEWPAPTEAEPWVLRHHMVKVRGRLATYVLDTTPQPGSGTPGIVSSPVRGNDGTETAELGGAAGTADAAAGGTAAAGVIAGGSAHADGKHRDSAPGDSAPGCEPSGCEPSGCGQSPAPNAITQVIGLRREERDGQQLLRWRLRPTTGRTHQLRVALRTLGVPILHDPLYETISDTALLDPDAPLPRPVSADVEDFSRPMELTAKELAFTDPLSGKARVFRSRY